MACNGLNSPDSAPFASLINGSFMVVLIFFISVSGVGDIVLGVITVFILLSLLVSLKKSKSSFFVLLTDSSPLE